MLLPGRCVSYHGGSPPPRKLSVSEVVIFDPSIFTCHPPASACAFRRYSGPPDHILLAQISHRLPRLGYASEPSRSTAINAANAIDAPCNPRNSSLLVLGNGHILRLKHRNIGAQARVPLTICCLTRTGSYRKAPSHRSRLERDFHVHSPNANTTSRRYHGDPMVTLRRGNACCPTSLAA